MTNAKPLTIIERLNNKEDQGKLKRLLDPNINFDRYLQIISNEIRANPKLLQCEPQSIMECLGQAARLNLDVGGASAQAYLIPYGNKCQFQISYKGLIALAYRAGVGVIETGMVYENDKYELQYGITKKLSVTPAFTNRGNPLFVWAMAKVNGEAQFIHMTIEEVEKVKAYSKTASFADSAWSKNYDEMAKIRVCKRFCKLLPAYTNNNLMQEAIALDEQADQGTQNNTSVFDHMTDVTPTTRGNEVEGTGTEAYVPEPPATTASKILEQMAS